MKTIMVTDSDFGATDKNFEYILGFQPSFGIMVLGKNKLLIFLDGRYFGMTQNINTYDIQKKLGNKTLKIEYKKIESGFEEQIADIISKKKECNFSENITLKFYNKIKKNLDEKISKESSKTKQQTPIKINIHQNILLKKRSIKTISEQKYIEKAISIIDKVFNNIVGLNTEGSLVGKTEKELAVLISSKITKYGGSGESFPTIVAFGKNSAIAHHIPDNTTIEEGPLLIDMGAVYNGYHSDFTRTFWVNNKKKNSKHKTDLYKEFQKVHSIVEQAHNQAFNNTKEGYTGEDIDRLARTHIKESGYGDMFIHSTGHGVGLDIHEQPWIAPNKNDIIQDNMVFTIEPGIYLPGKFGVRLEDIVFMKKGILEKRTNIKISL